VLTLTTFDEIDSKKFKCRSLKILSQTCQSLNISTRNKKTQKILAITKTIADVIFLSYSRLNSYVQMAAINNLKKFLNLTIILCIITVDHTGNILALKVKGIYLDISETALVSIYVPNNNNRKFYAD
jgi:uncharacterized membrane protein